MGDDEATLLATLKEWIVLANKRADAVAAARANLKEALAAQAATNECRDKANAAYQSALHGHAVEVKVTQPKDSEDDCG